MLEMKVYLFDSSAPRPFDSLSGLRRNQQSLDHDTQVHMNMKQMKFIFLKTYTLRLLAFVTDQIMKPLSLLNPPQSEADRMWIKDMKDRDQFKSTVMDES